MNRNRNSIFSRYTIAVVGEMLCLKPSPLYTLLTPITIYATLTQESQLLWTRSIVLQTRAARYEDDDCAKIEEYCRRMRRLLVYAQVVEVNHPESKQPKWLRERVRRVLANAMEYIPPGDFHPSQKCFDMTMTEVDKELNRLEDTIDRPDESELDPPPGYKPIITFKGSFP